MNRYRLFPSGELGMHPTGNWTPYVDAQRALDAERGQCKALKVEVYDQKKLAEKYWLEARETTNKMHEAQQQLTTLQAQLRQVEGERDHAKKMEAVQKEVADNQTWHVQKLKDWRDTVTLALQRPGGARFEDVPEHIKALVKEHATLRQLVEALQRGRE